MVNMSKRTCIDANAPKHKNTQNIKFANQKLKSKEID